MEVEGYWDMEAQKTTIQRTADRLNELLALPSNDSIVKGLNVIIKNDDLADTRMLEFILQESGGATTLLQSLIENAKKFGENVENLARYSPSSFIYHCLHSCLIVALQYSITIETATVLRDQFTGESIATDRNVFIERENQLVKMFYESLKESAGLLNDTKSLSSFLNLNNENASSIQYEHGKSHIYIGKVKAPAGR
jgi:hypothetical protein